MKKYILSAFIVAAASFASTAMAQQQKVNLNLGDNAVETVQLGEGDYIAFGRPAGVKEQKDVEVASTEVGKNYVSYKIETKKSDKMYQHMLLKKSYVELLATQLNGSFDESNEQELLGVFQTLVLAGYGYTATGTQSFTITDGVKDAAGHTQFIPGGQDYYLVTCGVTMDGETPTLDNDMAYTKLHTLTPGKSSETLTVEYKGLDENGKAFFDVQPGAGINTLHMVIGTAASIDEFVSNYGYDYLMFTQGSSFTRDQWLDLGKDDDQKWNVSKEADYSFYVLGIDNNGDWVKAEVKNQHIKPSAGNDCPEVDVTNKMAVGGEFAIQYEIKSKDSDGIKSAKFLVMKENDWDDALNKYKYEKPSDAWAEYMATNANATDVTDAIKQLGSKFTFRRTFTDEERGWYVAVLAVTDKYGTTVTRASFHSHIGEEENWDIATRTFPVK